MRNRVNNFLSQTICFGMLTLTACSALSPESTPTLTSTPIPTATQLPPTSTPEPTATPTPSPTPSSTPTPPPQVIGSLIDADDDTPLVGASVILCPQESSSSCCIDTSMSALTGENGEFVIEVPRFGDYVLFYNLNGDVRDSWNNLCFDFPAVSGTFLSVQDSLRSMWRGMKEGPMSTCFMMWGGKAGWSTYVHSGMQSLAFVWMNDRPLSVAYGEGGGEINLAVWNYTSQTCGESFQPLR